MLLPFWISLIAWLTFDEEKSNFKQLICFSMCYAGVVSITNPTLLTNHDTIYELAKDVKKYWWPIIVSNVASIFGAFNYLSTRRIGKMVHPSCKTMYLGLVSIILSLLTLLLVKPSYFLFWNP